MNAKMKWLGVSLLSVAVLAVIVTGFMMFGARFGFWEPIVGFGLVRNYGAPIGYFVTAIGGLGVVFLVVRKHWLPAICAGVACLIGLGLLAPTIASKMRTPVRMPPIHDITTNTSNPPQFLVLDETRTGAVNSLVYGGVDIATQQHSFYPDVMPIMSDASAQDAFAKALQVAQDMGWDIIAQDTDALRFEATAHTAVYHFADDVVVVVASDGAGSRVDMRSVSRIGRGDRGVNAARIQAFSQAFTN